LVRWKNRVPAKSWRTRTRKRSLFPYACIRRYTAPSGIRNDYISPSEIFVQSFEKRFLFGTRRWGTGARCSPRFPCWTNDLNATNAAARRLLAINFNFAGSIPACARGSLLGETINYDLLTRRRDLFTEILESISVCVRLANEKNVFRGLARTTNTRGILFRYYYYSDRSLNGDVAK